MRIARTFHAPAAEVFDAWIDPERLRAWWGPPGVSVPALDADLRVGGSYRIVMEGADGEQRVLVWTFREIARPERLVYDWQWTTGPETGPPSRVTVTFRAAGERTQVELTHTGIADPAIAANHAAGWAACLDGLDATLNRMV
jgi:uncharacterized protein YndB with AHSA1/START domain